ncbi:MAG: hypothetical protein KDA69_15080, partial [Planctomycetaceae bacterium]|nr:hypothetical protein [Planctomycetaceae bacterium]
MAGITVECSHCQTQLKLKDDSKVGKTAPCPKCKKKFVIQPIDEMAEDDFGDDDEFGGDDDFDDMPAPRKSSKAKGKASGGSSKKKGKGKGKGKGKKSSGGSMMPLLLGGGVLVLLLGVGGLLWGLGVFGGGDDTADNSAVASSDNSSNAGTDTASTGNA